MTNAQAGVLNAALIGGALALAFEAGPRWVLISAATLGGVAYLASQDQWRV